MVTKEMVRLAVRLAVAERMPERLEAVADRVAADWEAPAAGRKYWRLKRQDGSYEYREEPPDGQKGPGDDGGDGTKEKVKERVKEMVEEKGEEKGSAPWKGEELGKGVFKVKSGKDFGGLVKKCAESAGFGSSVEVKDEYPDDWTMFASEDGDAVAAVDGDGNLVSVVKAAGSKVKGWAYEAVKTGIRHGARKLDCFDTILPGAYAKAGMKPVAWMKFDESQAPKGWDYEKYKAYNGGRPRLVFMAYDGETRVYSTGDELPEVKSYDDGVRLQGEFLKGLGKDKGKEAGMSDAEDREKGAGEEQVKVPEASWDEVKEDIIASVMKDYGWTREKAEEELAKV